MSFIEACACGTTPKSSHNPLGICAACRARALRGARATPRRRIDWRYVITKYLPWLLSALTLWSMVLVGRLDAGGWALGLGVQALWLLWIVVSRSWGFLPMNVALWVVYAQNLWLWTPGK
jgi:hypothetical protein